MPSLAEQVVAIERSLVAAGIPHAFGGALALAFHIREPRATRDIDLNVFLSVEHADELFAALPAQVAWDAADVRRIQREAQVRVFWDETPLDLFFVNHRFHSQAADNITHVPFAGVELPILDANDLAVFKAFFDRTKDWADIEAMLEAETLDVHRVLGWLVDLLGGSDHRVERLRALTHQVPASGEPRFDPGQPSGRQ